jgi:hypothetical protein
MSIAYFLGIMFGTFIWGGIASAILMAIFRRADRRLMITIGLGLAVLASLPLGLDVMIETLLSAIPVWFILSWLATRNRAPKEAVKSDTVQDPHS